MWASMAGGRGSGGFGASKLAGWWWCAAVAVLSLAVPTSGQGCSTDLTGKVTKFSTANLVCRAYRVQSSHTFYIWALKDNTTKVTSIVYSAPLTTQYWAGLGFSANGAMVGSTALISTLNATGLPVAKVYSLKGQSSAQVVEGTGLTFVGGPAEAYYDQPSQTVYVSMEVDFANSTAKPTFLLMAYGPENTDGTLARHNNRIYESAQFITGVVAPTSFASKLEKKAKIHGSLNILGWGLLLPVGAMVARYARGFDPAWFYTHIAFQTVGFACVIAGVTTGVRLTKDIQPVHLNAHRGLGIFIFILAILQVLALAWRPKKDAKVRKYWNWYHHWVGRLALFLAAVNIFVGLKLGNAERDFRVGYISILGIELVAFAILELLLWLRWNRQRPNRQSSFPDDNGFQYGGSV